MAKNYSDKDNEFLKAQELAEQEEASGVSSDELGGHKGVKIVNLTEEVNYKIIVKDDIETILEDHCEEYQISKEDIRISVKVGKNENKIYTLSELVDGVLLEDKIKALDKEEISIRVWVSQNSTLPLGSNIHYHGIVDVIDYIPEDVVVSSEMGE